MHLSGDGVPLWVESLKKVLEDEKATVSTALITHWHHDHVGGIEELRELSPEAKIWKNDPWEDQSEIKDGQSFETEGAKLTAYHTPGHTTDHMCFYLHEEKALFTGDNVLGHGTTIFQNLSEYISSLRKMLSIPGLQKTGYPGHGQVIKDVKTVIDGYIAHRAARERQVTSALTEGAGRGYGDPMTSSDMVRRIYRDEIPEELYAAAEHGVNQILEKMESEKRVIRDGKGWQLVNNSSGAKSNV